MSQNIFRKILKKTRVNKKDFKKKFQLNLSYGLKVISSQSFNQTVFIKFRKRKTPRAGLRLPTEET